MLTQQQLETRAAELKKNQTRHERWVWQKMKRWCAKKDLLCYPQIAMHGFILDFYFPQLNLAIELDGRQHDPHRDAWRDTKLLKNGVRVLRFANPRNVLELNAVLYKIYAEAAYQIRRAKKYRPGVFSTNSQASQRSQVFNSLTNKKNLAVSDGCGKVENDANS